MTELTAEDMIGFFRDVISGKVKVEGTNEKRNRRVEVWLKEHGIEPYSWESK